MAQEAERAESLPEQDLRTHSIVVFDALNWDDCVPDNATHTREHNSMVSMVNQEPERPSQVLALQLAEGQCSREYGHDGEKGHFKQEALRVLQDCEHLLCSIDSNAYQRPHISRVLDDISRLQRTFGRKPRARVHRPRRFTLAAGARRVLAEWVEKHMEDPYPTTEEKQEIASAAQLSLRQVNDWFTNYRKRHWQTDMGNYD